jgi:hypothetical protein
MRRRVVVVLSAMALAIQLAGGMAQAIINGQPDRGPNAHPNVGAYVAKLQGKLHSVCSGTLIAPKVFLTAGHCTYFEIQKNRPAYVSFDPSYKPGASRLIKGTPYLHPGFCRPTLEEKGKCHLPPKYPSKILGDPNRTVRYDVGVVVLEEPVRMATYGALPKAGLVDTLKEGQRLTTVGYGVTGYEIGGGPRPQPVYPEDRYRATVRLLNTRDPAVGEMLVKTTSVSFIKGKGAGPCSGDSGGPLFLPDQQTIVGVTSGGYPLCRGSVYYQRMDLPQVLKWVRSFP